MGETTAEPQRQTSGQAPLDTQEAAFTPAWPARSPGPDRDTMVPKDTQPVAGLSPAGKVGRGSEDAVYCDYTEGNPKLQRDPSLSLLSGALWLGSQAAAKLGQQCGGARQVGVRQKSLRLAGPEAWGEGSNCQAGSDPAFNLETERKGEPNAVSKCHQGLNSQWSPGCRLTQQSVLPLLACPSLWARLDRWADGLKRGPSRPPCDTLPPPHPIGHGGAPVLQLGSAEPTCPVSEDACSGGLARAT